MQHPQYYPSSSSSMMAGRQQQKKKLIILTTTILLCLAILFYDDDKQSRRSLLRRALLSSSSSSSSSSLSYEYLEGSSTLHPWAEHNVMNIIEPPHYYNADDNDDNTEQHKTTALFFHIPRSGSGTIKQLYQSCSSMNDMTIATAHTKGGIARAVDLELVYRSSSSQQQDYDSNSDSLPDNNANAETTTTTSYKADILFTTEPHYAGSNLFNPSHKGRYLSIFRSPIDRSISTFYYLQTATNDIRHRAKYTNMTLLEWANIPNEEDNYMVHKLVGKTYGDVVTEADLIIAKELIRQRFVVGLLNEYEESVRRFNVVLGRGGIDSSDEELQCMNEFGAAGVVNNLYYPKVEVGSPEYEAIVSKNYLDILLYKYIEEELFDEQQEIINSYVEAQQQLRAQQEINNSYNEAQQQQAPLRVSQDYSNAAVIVAQGAGPEFTRMDGQVVKLDSEPLWSYQGATWYNALSSSTFHWNLAPYRFDGCPEGANMFNLKNGFIFHESDPKNPGTIKSRYLKFRVQRRNDRRCEFNGSEICLGGGNLIMNFGMNAPEMYAPGSFNVGRIRIVAHNTIGDCARTWYDPADSSSMLQTQGSRNIILEKAPIDYLKQNVAVATNPERCEAWIKEREVRNDLFHFNSDQSTIHIDTPWMQITIDVRQNKVPTADTCSYAKMKVWISDINPSLLKETSIGGILGGGQAQDVAVGGPFNTEYMGVDPSIMITHAASSEINMDLLKGYIA